MIVFMVLALAVMSEASHYYSLEEVPEGRIAADPTFYRRLDHIRGFFGHKPFGHFWAKYWVKNKNQRREKRQVGNYNSFYTNTNNQIPSYYNTRTQGLQRQRLGQVQGFGQVQRAAQPQSFDQNPRYAQQQFNQYPSFSQDQRFAQDQRFRFRQNPRPRTTTTTAKPKKKKPFRPPMVFF